MKHLITLLMIAPAAFAQQPCTLEGRVADEATGRPIAKAHLFVIPAASGPAIRSNTDQEGKFCFARLDPGSYSLLAKRAGYLDAVYQGSRFPRFNPTLRIDAQSHASPLILKMSQRSILAGRVVDADGDPVAYAQVEATGSDGGAFFRREPGTITRTDVRGFFRLYDLDPGTYRLAATPRQDAGSFAGYRNGYGGSPQDRQVETYYPSSPTVERATPIVLKAGREIEDIVIAMQVTSLRHISGRIAGIPVGSYFLAEIKRPSGSVEGRAIRVGKDGSFYQDGLLPGMYKLRISGLFEKMVDLTSGDVDGLLIEPVGTGN